MATALASLSGSHARAHPSTSACAYDVSVRSVGQNGIYKSCYGYGCQVVERLSKLCARAPAHTVPCIGHGARLQQFTHHHWPA